MNELFVIIRLLQAWAQAGGVIFTRRAKVLRSLSPQDSHMILSMYGKNHYNIVK